MDLRYLTTEVSRQVRTRWMLRGLGTLPPLELPREKMQAEVHMLVGRRHFVRAVAALQTFYRRSELDDRVGLTLYDDGSLTPAHRCWIERHVRGARWISYPYPTEQIREALRHRPLLAQWYESKVSSCLPRYVHMALLSRADRGIQLDSDITFYAPPQAIIDWVDGRMNHPMHALEGPVDKDPGQWHRDQFDRICRYVNPGQPMHIGTYEFNAGLMLLRPGSMNLDLAERFYQWLADNQATATGKWYVPWMTEQTVMMLHFAAWPDAQPFDESYGIQLAPARVCSHFAANTYYHPQALRRTKRALEELRRKSP